MTENNEKVAEELAKKAHESFDSSLVVRWEFISCWKEGFLAGIAHERARNKSKRPEEPTVDFGTFKARVEDL